MSLSRLTRGWVLTLLLLAPLLNSGCAEVRDPVSQIGVGQSADRADAGGVVEQSPGRDAINLSPSIAVTGGGLGAVVLAGLVLLKVQRRGAQRIIRLFIEVIEASSDPAPIKQLIAMRAMWLGMTKPVHKAVKRWTK